MAVGSHDCVHQGGSLGHADLCGLGEARAAADDCVSLRAMGRPQGGEAAGVFVW